MWWNKEAGKAVKNKACAWKRYQANRSNHNYREYVKECDKTAKIIRKVKQNFEKFFSKTVKKNKKLFYEYVNSKNKCKVPVTQIKKSDGDWTASDVEASETLNDYFQSVFTKEEDRDLMYFNDFARLVFLDEIAEPVSYSGPTTVNCINEIDINIDQVKSLLKSLNINKTMGPDKMHVRILRELANEKLHH